MPEHLNNLIPAETSYTPIKSRGITWALWRKMVFNPNPKYWVLALVLFICRLFALIPHPLLLQIGRQFGRIIGAGSKRLRHITLQNVALCYPELCKIEQHAFVKTSFRELGIAIAETLKVWFFDTSRLWSRTEIEGLEHWQQALDSGRGIILLSCHYGSLDLNVSLVSHLVRRNRKFVFTYRQPSDPLIDDLLKSTRSIYGDHFYSVKNLVGITRALRKKGVVWYAPDIEVKNKNTVFADFMGVPASTTVAVGRLAAATGALVVPFGHYRKECNSDYTLKIYPPIADFPVGDNLGDTTTINRAIERIIEPYPQRYWWVIKRFKNRPEGAPPVY